MSMCDWYLFINFFMYLNQSNLNSLGNYKLLNTMCQSIIQHFILFIHSIIIQP